MFWRSRKDIAIMLETPGDSPGGKGECARTRPDDRPKRQIF